MENSKSVTINKKIRLRQEVFRFLKGFGDNIGAKFSNICSKTAAYDVPLELYQKRTPRKNRTLISWKKVVDNKLEINHLESFEGGVVVEFKNDDFFSARESSDDYEKKMFDLLSKRLGSNEKVSAIISIRSEEGSSSSKIQRDAFTKLVNNTKVKYRDHTCIIDKVNYMNFAIKQDKKGCGQGNETWSGFLFVSIKGGQQDKIETHAGQELTLFNPACEYASSDVCEDINLVMGYYALLSIAKTNKTRNILIEKVENMLKLIKYDFKLYNGDLLSYVKKQYCVSLCDGILTDPIQLKPIIIDKFNIKERKEDSIDLTHNQAVLHEKYYWDKEKNCVLSPARPTNIFWSLHLSNMMQQNFTLDEYFDLEKERYEKRQARINEIKSV